MSTEESETVEIDQSNDDSVDTSTNVGIDDTSDVDEIENADSESDDKSEIPLTERIVDDGLLQRIVEGALLAAGKPMSIQQLAELFDKKERPKNDRFQKVLENIQNEISGRGFELKQVASGYRFQVIQDVSPWVSRMWDEKPQKYSRALLETLSLIAYRQPITRGDIEDIRGVAVSSHIIKTLMEREWIRIVGHKDVPGRPAMFATTRQFLDYFNLKNLDELPSLAEIRDLDSMNEELALEGADTPAVNDNEKDIGDEKEENVQSDLETDSEAGIVNTDTDTDTDTDTGTDPVNSSSGSAEATETAEINVSDRTNIDDESINSEIIDVETKEDMDTSRLDDNDNTLGSDDIVVENTGNAVFEEFETGEQLIDDDDFMDNWPHGSQESTSESTHDSQLDSNSVESGTLDDDAGDSTENTSAETDA